MKFHINEDFLGKASLSFLQLLLQYQALLPQN